MCATITKKSARRMLVKPSRGPVGSSHGNRASGNQKTRQVDRARPGVLGGMVADYRVGNLLL